MAEEKKLKILAVQMSSEIGDKAQNIKKADKLIYNGIEDNTDVIVLPEVWNVGWSCNDFQSSAEDFENGETIAFLSETARKYNCYIIGGSIITKNKCNFYNTCPVFDRNGNLVASYNKMHLFSYYGCNEGKYVSVGKEPVMIGIDGIKFGLTICYDIRFPEIYRAYRKAGADVLVNVAAWSVTKKMQWKTMTKSRATENQCYMIAVNQTGPIEGDINLGYSRIIDYKGKTMSMLEDEEGTVSAEIKINDMYEFREKCRILNDIHEKYDVRII